MSNFLDRINIFKTLSAFDDITRFRGINSLMVVFGLNLIIPILSQFRGELLSAEVISIFMIGTTLAVKMNVYLVKLSIGTVYKLGNIVHIILTFSIFLYFYNPLYFIILDSLLGIIEVAVFSSFSIQLDQYLAKHNPDMFSRFKIFMNSKNADVVVFGLLCTTFMLYITSVGFVFCIFFVYNLCFLTWLIYNWNFFENNLKD